MPAIAHPLKILLVEDNPADAFLLRKMLTDVAVATENIFEAAYLTDAMVLSTKAVPEIILLDLSLPDSFGLETFEKFHDTFPDIPIIILTGLADSATALLAIKHGAQDYLIKGELNVHWLSRAIQYSIERAQNLVSLRNSEEKYREMFRRNPFATFIVDISTLRILEVNDAALEKYGYTREELLALTADQIRHPDDRNSLYQQIHEEGTGARHNRGLVRHLTRNGSIIYMEATYYPIEYFGKTAMQAQMNDVTERVRLEADLEREQAATERAVTAAALQAQEQERKAIGEELHDNVNQVITAARLYVDLAMKKNDAPEMLTKAMEYLALAIEENRKLSRSLILPQLRGEGLLGSVKELVQEAALSTGLAIHLSTDQFTEDHYSETEKTALFRIIQEQVNNIIKHAKAANIWIQLSGTSHSEIVEIRDDGVGFDTALKRKGVGLTNIQSRAKVLNAVADIDSSPGTGCLLTIKQNNIPEEK